MVSLQSAYLPAERCAVSDQEDPTGWEYGFDKFADDIVKREEAARKAGEEQRRMREQESWGLQRDKASREHPLQRLRTVK